uniref:Uncharacterized protein n=1 Tax=Arundo donax TaxID=35708 RepID=A0A0A9FR65_ARUDO
MASKKAYGALAWIMNWTSCQELTSAAQSI